MAGKWKIVKGMSRISQDLRLKSEKTKQGVYTATSLAATVGERAMQRQIMTSGTSWRRSHPTNPSDGRIDTGRMLASVGKTVSRKQTSVEATFGYMRQSADSYYFIFQDEGFNYVHGNNPHWVPGTHARTIGAIEAREYLRRALKNLGLRRNAGITTASLPNPKYGG